MDPREIPPDDEPGRDEAEADGSRAEAPATGHAGGMPGGGVGRREEVGHTGVHPYSTVVGETDMPVRTGGGWGHHGEPEATEEEVEEHEAGRER